MAIAIAAMVAAAAGKLLIITLERKLFLVQCIISIVMEKCSACLGNFTLVIFSKEEAHHVTKVQKRCSKFESKI